MAESSTTCPLNIQEGLERAGDDMDFYKELLEMFLSDAPERMVELEQAIAGKNAPQICSVSHSLKGAAANLSAGEVRAAAYALENKGRAGETEGLEPLYQSLSSELKRLADFVATL